MEPSEVWPGIDSALHDLGILCSGQTNLGNPMECTEKSRVLINELNLNANSGKCHDRYLMPCQAWNRPVLTDLGEINGQNDSWSNNHYPPDGENSENSYSGKGAKLVKISDPKGVVEFGKASHYSPCLSEVIRENQELSVLRMNSHYMTGVSIATAGASGIVLQQSDFYSKSINSHGTPKHGPSVMSVRHHHVRPYEIPWRREDRVRTKSETAEKEAAMKLMDCIDVPLNYPVINNFGKFNAEKCRHSLLKSRSLENVKLAEDEILHTPVYEMDSMSHRIQHLHVDE